MIDRVKYSKEFPSSRGNVWIGMEGSVDPGQTPEQQLDEIRLKVDAFMLVGNSNYNVDVVYEEGKLPVIQLRDDESRDNILKNIPKH